MSWLTSRELAALLPPSSEYEGSAKAACSSSRKMRQGAAAYAHVSIRQLTSAYVSIRQHTSACVSIRQHTTARQHTSAYVSIRQHTSAYVSIRQHTSAYVSICQHASAYVSIRVTSMWAAGSLQLVEEDEAGRCRRAPCVYLLYCLY